MNSIEEYDFLKTKILKYVLFKKRTEREVRQKFSENAGILLEDVIEYLKQEKYIDDENYIIRSVNEFINLKNLSLKELKYKLLTKGINKDLIEDYIANNKDNLLEYELKSATRILIKKENLLPKEEIINYLRKKGYLEETIKNI